MVGLETVSWVCILGAVPFAAVGFLKYNGMTAEKFLMAWIRSEILMPKHLVFGNTNIYWQLLEEKDRKETKPEDADAGNVTTRGKSEKTESKPNKSHKNTKSRGRRNRKA